jgi:hypothetical protein
LGSTGVDSAELVGLFFSARRASPTNKKIIFSTRVGVRSSFLKFGGACDVLSVDQYYLIDDRMLLPKARGRSILK